MEWLHVVHNLLEKMMEEGVAVGVASERARSYHGSLLINYQKTGNVLIKIFNVYIYMYIKNYICIIMHGVNILYFH